MGLILSLVAMLVAVIAMLAINYIIYKREKTLIEINEKYKKFYNLSLEECVKLKRLLVSTDKEKRLTGRLSTIALRISIIPTLIPNCLSMKRNAPL